MLVVGENAAHLGGRNEDVLWTGVGVEAFDGRRVHQVEFGAGTPDDVGVSQILQRAANGATDQSTVAGDKYA